MGYKTKTFILDSRKVLTERIKSGHCLPREFYAFKFLFMQFFLTFLALFGGCYI